MKPRAPKKILLLALGGTIACKKTPKGLAPKLKAADLLSAAALPRAASVEAVDFMTRTIVFTSDWIALSEEIVQRFDEYDGFVITLGTDTLAYVSSALSLMLRNLSKPVVLTGAMTPIGAKDGYAARNLSDAIRIAAAGVGGVFVAFHGKVLDGRRASKVRTEDADAFDSINAPPLATVRRGGGILWRSKPSKPKGKLSLQPYLDIHVASVKLSPQTTAEDLAGFSNFSGLLVEGYGDGNVPSCLVPTLKRMARKQLVVLASQCPYGRVSHRYEGGAALIRGGVLSAGDKTKEFATVKLMWALGKSGSRAMARRAFL
jgi:L-asparaginase